MSTSKLKRKAEHDPDLLANNNLNESFVSYGTALPSLASTRKDQGEYVPVWQQEVRDEKGRRRLHGAFTGGFSAGYFNSVGSKEGWAPSTFVSKKDAKGKGKAGSSARPEDFMDEEDLAELKASKGFKTADEYGNDSNAGINQPFAGEGKGKEPGYSSAVANSLKDLVRPGSSRIGERIMTKMGWRPGQGVGPRLSYARRKEVLKDLGLPSTEGYTEDDEDGPPEEAKKHTYAPVDRPLMTFEGKENQWGLGYVPGENLADSLAGPSTSKRPFSSALGSRRDEDDMETDANTPAMPRGAGFGISALEDADEDDEDIYSMGAEGRSTMVLHDEDEEDDSFGQRRPELHKYQDRSKAKLRESKQDRSKAIPREIQKFSDGTPVVPGFVLASKAQPPDQWFPAPPVPKGWQPNPKAVWERDRIKTAPTSSAPPAPVPQAGQKGKHNMLSADDRGSILGEPVAPESVFDFLSAKNKERLAGLAQSNKAGPASNAVPLPKQEGLGPTAPEEVIDIPSIEARVAQNALKGFMPYGDDPARQARYKAYLSHSALPRGTSGYDPVPLPGKRIADLNRELADFANAAMIFKPMTGMMANRFTSGSASSTLLTVPESGLKVPVVKPILSPAASKEEEDSWKKKEQDEKDRMDPRRAAARAGMFGHLTRTTEPFYPARLVCKRLNVADPYPEGPTATPEHASFGQPPSAASSSSANQAGASDVLGQDTMDEIMRGGGFTQGGGMNQPGPKFTSVPGSSGEEQDKENIQPSQQQRKERAIPSLANVGLGEDETQGRDTLTYEKPSMDIFKAIFANSEDEDDDDEAEDMAKKPQGSVANGSKADAVELDDPSARPDTSALGGKSAKKDEAHPAPVTAESLAAFKPTFVSKSERPSVTDGNSDKKKDKEKKKKKKSSAAIVSFEVEDDGDEAGPALDVRESSKSKKRKSEEKDKDKEKKSKKEKAIPLAAPEEDEWVEKEAPAPPATAAMPAFAQAGQANGNADLGRKNTRMRASELF